MAAGRNSPMQTYHDFFAARLDERRMRKEAVEAFLKPRYRSANPHPPRLLPV